MTITSWAKGKTEQELQIRDLERRVYRLLNTRKSVVVHSYTEPTQASWERAYLQQYQSTSTSLPIPPGMRCCWYNMMNGTMELYMTAFDRENGLSSSGRVYPAVRNQNPSAIRYIGEMRSDGRIKSTYNDNSRIVLGSNINAQKRRGLLMLEIFFRIWHPYENDSTDFLLDVGHDVVQPEIVTTAVLDYQNLAGRGIASVLSVVNNTYNNFPREVPILNVPEIPDNANGATAFPPIVGHLQLYNPFGTVFTGSTDELDFDMNVIGQGMLYHFPNNYLVGAAIVASISQFMFSSMHPLKLGKDWRLKLTETTGNEVINDMWGDSWVYGYYVRTQETVKEYENVI